MLFYVILYLILSVTPYYLDRFRVALHGAYYCPESNQRGMRSDFTGHGDTSILYMSNERFALSMLTESAGREVFVYKGGDAWLAQAKDRFMAKQDIMYADAPYVDGPIDADHPDEVDAATTIESATLLAHHFDAIDAGNIELHHPSLAASAPALDESAMHEYLNAYSSRVDDWTLRLSKNWKSNGELERVRDIIAQSRKESKAVAKAVDVVDIIATRVITEDEGEHVFEQYVGDNDDTIDQITE